jgi:hypothetical protein
MYCSGYLLMSVVSLAVQSVLENLGQSLSNLYMDVKEGSAKIDSDSVNVYFGEDGSDTEM